MDANTKLEIVKLIVLGALGLFAGIIILILIHSKKAGKFQFGKTGFSFEVESKSKNSNYEMARNIQDLDTELKGRCRKITNDLRSKIIQGLLDVGGICPIVRLALASSLRVPLYQSIEENGFKKKFSSDNVTEYLNTLVEEIKLDYQEFSYLIKDVCKQEQYSIPGFEIVRPSIKKLLETFWIKKIIQQMILICEKKIALYNRYKILFTDLGDNYMLNVIDTLINKNMKHIEALRS